MTATLTRDATDDCVAVWGDGERYALVAELATGGSGQVTVAIDRMLGRRVAIKRALDRAGDSRLEREAQVLARLDHPAIVPIHDAGFDRDGTPYYTMKLLDGRDLAARIADAKTFEQRLGLVPVVAAVIDAMAYAHRERVIHRDLKPKNVLVGDAGEVYVIDWGLGKLLGTDETIDFALTRPGSVMGTPAYMAPEQALGDDVDERADVYALGAMLYHVLSGQVPYGGRDGEAALAQLTAGPPPPLATREPRAARELVAIVERAMARDPAARYRTAGALAQALAAARRPAVRRLSPWLFVAAGAMALATAIAAVTATHASAPACPTASAAP